MTNQPIVREATINAEEPELLDLISFWNTAAQGTELGIGIAVSEAMSRASNLRRQVEGGSPTEVDLNDQGQAADILHALCRSLMDDCVGSPRDVLDGASSVQGVLAASRWVEDELEEREELLCSLSFIAWRAARLLGLSREAQLWELRYRRTFLGSLQWKVAEGLWLLEARGDMAAEDTLAQGPEALFQALLYFESEGEADPQKVMKSAISLYCSLRPKKHALAPDLRSFFLGESARIVAGMLRMIGELQKSEEWLTLAEGHFRVGANARPHLARVTFGRLALLNVLSRCEEVCQAAPELDQTFAELGMEEDRAKGRILWSMSLKLLGRLQEATEVLEPVLMLTSEIRPALYGWALLQSGDIQQICGNYERALKDLTHAARLLRQGRQFTGLADVNVILSGLYRAHGKLREALELIETSRQEHERLGMKWSEAYTRMLIAETYLSMDRPRDAEREIRAALPVLKGAGAVPDALAGINLLREAVRRRALDPQTLSEIREHLRPKN
jgi:tetratricopeptide (TPR) repeat protein